MTIIGSFLVAYNDRCLMHFLLVVASINHLWTGYIWSQECLDSVIFDGNEGMTGEQG